MSSASRPKYWFNKKNVLIFLGFSLLIVLATIFFFFHWPLFNPLCQARSNHYYFAQQMATGQVLYQDLFSVKPPLTEYVGAVCFRILQGEIIPAIILTRFVFFYLFVLAAIPLFIISKYAFQRYLFAWFVVLIYLSFNYPYVRMAEGADWHTLMNLFGLLSVAFVLKDRYILSGLFAALATLSWMPGIVFLIAVLSVQVLAAQGNRMRNTLKIFLGFFFPIVVFLLYAYSNRSLSDFIKQTILYGEINIKHQFLAGRELILKNIKASYTPQIPLIFLGCVGFMINLVQIILARSQKAPLKNFLALGTIFFMTVVYSLVDFQGIPDFIPFIPLLAFYAVYFITFLRGIKKSLVKDIIFSGLIVSLMGWSLRTSIIPAPKFSLEKQQKAFRQELGRFDLGKTDLLCSVNSTLPLLFMNKKNAVKYVHFSFDRYYQFMEKYEAGGFDSIVSAIEKKKPKLIYFRRYRFLAAKPRYRKLNKILTAHYTIKAENKKRTIFLRK